MFTNDKFIIFQQIRNMSPCQHYTKVVASDEVISNRNEHKHDVLWNNAAVASVRDLLNAQVIHKWYNNVDVSWAPLYAAFLKSILKKKPRKKKKKQRKKEAKKEATTLYWSRRRTEVSSKNNDIIIIIVVVEVAFFSITTVNNHATFLPLFAGWWRYDDKNVLSDVGVLGLLW